MIIRHKHKGRFTVVPNAIFNDDRISLGAKGLLGYLLSRPGNWDVRHDQLQHQMGIGRKLLSKYLKELEKAGYLERDEEQGRDEHNRFTTLNYVVRDIPELTTADALVPLRLEPQRDKDTGNNKEEIKTDSNNPFPKPLSTVQAESKQACQDRFSDFGQRAQAAGNHPVYVGSKPYQAWFAVRGADGMPGYVDRAFVGGKPRMIVWMPSVYPPKEPTEF
jgi:DNA-binding HxlR family transcriptional regulator